VRKHQISSYTQQFSMAQTVVKNLIESKNKGQIKYVLSVAELKSKSDDLFVKKIKKLSDRAIMKLGISAEKTRMANLHIYNLEVNGVQRLINKAQNALDANE